MKITSKIAKSGVYYNFTHFYGQRTSVALTYAIEREIGLEHVLGWYNVMLSTTSDDEDFDTFFNGLNDEPYDEDWKNEQWRLSNGYFNAYMIVAKNGIAFIGTKFDDMYNDPGFNNYDDVENRRNFYSDLASKIDPRLGKVTKGIYTYNHRDLHNVRVYSGHNLFIPNKHVSSINYDEKDKQLLRKTLYIHLDYDEDIEAKVCPTYSHPMSMRKLWTNLRVSTDDISPLHSKEMDKTWDDFRKSQGVKSEDNPFSRYFDNNSVSDRHSRRKNKRTWHEFQRYQSNKNVEPFAVRMKRNRKLRKQRRASQQGWSDLRNSEKEPLKQSTRDTVNELKHRFRMKLTWFKFRHHIN